MKRLFLTLNILLSCLASLPAQHIWAEQSIPTPGGFGGAVTAVDMAMDPSENIFVFGTYSGGVSWGIHSLLDDNTVGDEGPVFLAKYDPNGNALWAHGIKGKGSNEGLAVATDGAGAVYVAGQYEQTNSFTILDLGNGITLEGNASQSVFIGKATTDGTFQWAKRILATDDIGSQFIKPNDMVVDGADIYIIGTVLEAVSIDTSSFNLTNPDQTQLFIAKYDTAGTFKWFKHTNGENEFGFAEGNYIHLSNTGNIYAVGTYGTNNSPVSWDGDTLDTSSLLGNRHLFIGSFDPDGNMNWHQWAAASGGTAQEPHAVGVDANGNIYTTIRASGTTEIGDTSFLADRGQYLVKYNSIGNREFVKPFFEFAPPLAPFVQVHSAHARADGRTYFVGTQSPSRTLIFGNDTLPGDPGGINLWNFAAMFDANGNALGGSPWADEYIGAFNEFTFSGLLQDQQGNLLFNGLIENGSARLGTDTLGLDIAQDHLFLVKTNPDSFLMTTGISSQTFTELAISLYPNPTSHSFTLAYKPTQVESMQLTLVNLQGQIVHRESLRFSPNVSEYTIEPVGILPGMYLLQLEDTFRLIYRQKVMFN